MSISADEFNALACAAMSEAEFQAAVLAEAKRHGWWCFVVPPNVRKCPRCGSGSFRWTNPGWPDVVLIRGNRLLVRELKAEHGRVRATQRWVLEILSVCGVDAKVWRPSEWDRIVEELAS